MAADDTLSCKYSYTKATCDQILGNGFMRYSVFLDAFNDFRVKCTYLQIFLTKY